VKLLLDTCTFLWIVTGSSRLSKQAAQWFSDPANDVFLSVVSAWEISVKHSLGTLRLPVPPIDFIPSQREAHGIAALPLTEEEVLYLPKTAPRSFRPHADLPSNSERSRCPDS
jgi:PIN domain nuclease of toxin-antitoxin system